MTETVFERAKQNLISRFNQAYMDDYGREKGEQYRVKEMKWELQTLLEEEVRGWKDKQYTPIALTPAVVEQRKELLGFYREVFDFEAEYNLHLRYETYPNTVFINMPVEEDEVEDYLSGNTPIDASEFHYDSDDIELESELNTDKEPKKSCAVMVEELRLKEQYLNKTYSKQKA
tara:strand:+ start:1528 stop:2049 length:522 start_codon:yes stop_codon:yes gene_type:complete